MTLESIKAEIREAFDKELIPVDYLCTMNGETIPEDRGVALVVARFHSDRIKSFLDTALDRIAAETKKAIVPPKETPDGFDLEAMARGAVPTSVRLRPEQHGHNSARSQMEANYQSWTKKV